MQKIQIFRYITQIILFFLLPGLYILAFSELKMIYQMIIKGNFSFLQSFPGLIEFTTVIILTILLGRFFCGWFCAFGTYNDWIHLISKNVFKIDFQVNKKIDSALKYVKYLILLMLLIVLCSMKSTIFDTASPWDAFAQITDFSHVLLNLTIGFILLVLITIGALFVERFFCRYLCPLGAVFNIVSRVSIFKIKKPNDKCGKCRVCTNNCSMGLPLFKVNNVRGGDCINCLKCVEVCPRKNTQANILGENVNPALAGSVAIATFATVYGVNNLGSVILTDTGLASTTSVISSSIKSPSEKYKDGTYIGTGIGFSGGTTKISVTISTGKIANIETISNEDTPNFYDRAKDLIPNEIISAQSTSVDTVSGATYSSKGIISAVQDALSQASLGASTPRISNNNISSNDSAKTDTTNTQIGTNSSSSNSTTNKATESTIKPSKNNSTTSNSATTQNNTSAKNSATTQNSTTTQKDASNSKTATNSSATQQSKYRDGTYVGTGTGFRDGTTKISVTVSNGKIANVETISNEDTPRFYTYAENTIANEIISTQSTSVDTVSGATYSSRGVIAAVADALSQAK